MTLVNYKQYGPWNLEKIHTNFGHKQLCEIEGCGQKSRSQFKIYSEPTGTFRHVCSYCASYLTGLDIVKLSSVETYIESVKNQFKNLKNLVGMGPVYNHPCKDLVGKLDTTIGAHRIIITSFKDRKYNLIIDGRPIKASLNKSFRSKTEVTEHAINCINNLNKDKLYYFIINS
ncbi:MAG TPA: hypothetical protein DEG92_07120 [Rikenellaceae bacterium]|nr:hypothetical protein [Rikenellaceae bacterium]